MSDEADGSVKEGGKCKLCAFIPFLSNPFQKAQASRKNRERCTKGAFSIRFIGAMRSENEA